MSASFSGLPLGFSQDTEQYFEASRNRCLHSDSFGQIASLATRRHNRREESYRFLPGYDIPTTVWMS